MVMDKAAFTAFNGLHGHGVTHRHTRSEVGVGDALGSDGLEHSAHDRVAARVPTGRNDAHRTSGFGALVQAAAQVYDLRVDVKAVHGVDAEGQDFFGILLYAACRGAENGHVDVLQIADVVGHGVAGQFGRSVFGTSAAHDTGHLKVGGGLKGLKRIAAYVAIAHNGCSNLFHTDVLRFDSD